MSVGGIRTTLDVDPAVLSSAILDGMRELVALVDDQFRIVGLNDQVAVLLGREADDLLGTSALDHIAPEHHDRAATLFAMAGASGTMAGSAEFDLVRADGTTVSVEVAGIDTVADNVSVFTLVGRPATVSRAVATLLDGLLAGADLAPVMTPLLEFFAWREIGSHIAISWSEDGRWRSVSTSLPDELTGAGDMNRSGRNPWRDVRREGDRRLGPVDDLLEPDDRDLASELGLHHLWIEPTVASGPGVDAVVTVWTGATYGPEVHSWGMEEAQRYVRLILLWTDQARRLDGAAHTDDLTGMANRRAFFDLLGAGRGGGAILFADLNGFKTVNDRWGHATGDAVLIEAGRRIAEAVRIGDCVARIGGDEFAVVLFGATVAAATSAVQRVRTAFEHPFDVHGTAVTLGISVGLAADETDLSEATVHAADRDQYADKHNRRGRR